MVNKNIVLISLMFISFCSALAQTNSYTEAEKNWLLKYKDSINIFVECNFSPFVYMDNDSAKGASIDLLKIIEKELGASFHYNKCSSLKEVLENIKTPGKNVVTSVKRTSEREKFMAFSKFYFEIPVVIVSRKEIDEILDFRKLDNYNIAIGNKYGVTSYIKQSYPDYKLKFYKNDYECLQNLAFGNVDIAITDIASYSHITKTYLINNIKVSNVIPFSYNLAFGVSLGQDTLLHIINKALSNISFNERNKILNKWVVLKIDKSNGYTKYLKYIVIVGVGIVLLFILIILWNSTLRKQIGRKTKLLNEELQNKTSAENELIAINKKLNQERKRAEESDRLKSAFLANMSHEIRTPMNGILGFSELLQEPRLSEKRHKEYISVIQISGIRMLNIINDIVDISKIEAGLIKLDIQEMNINELIEFVYTIFKPEVEAKGMKISYQNSLSAKEAIINTDYEKVYAIVTNLVKNALKYSKAGTIEIGGSSTKLNELQFYVKDTGIGIARDRQEAIFERFIQADIEDKMAYQGAGLGLAISKAYIEMLGGKIWVESQEGIGSTFYFTLPYNSELKEEKVVPKDDAKNKNKTEISGLKILIVEDDEISEQYISIIIEKMSKEILTAQTGIEALEICRLHSDIDLILMDIRMPVMGGYEVTRQIRQFNKSVVIIAQTAFGLSGDREKAIEAGCNDYISKPIKKDELLTVIQKYF